MGKARYSTEDLTAAAAANNSVMGVLRTLGIRPAGGSHAHISRRIKALGLDTSHFIGQGSNKGRTFPKQRRQVFLILPSGSSKIPTSQLKRALLEAGVTETCSVCGVREWLGKPIVLDIDHINGQWLDNRKENLRFLCPNCHRQTPTHGNRKRSS